MDPPQSHVSSDVFVPSAMDRMDTLIVNYCTDCLPSKSQSAVMLKLRDFVIDCIRDMFAYEEYEDCPVIGQEAYIFGSVGTEIQTRYSDIDVAIHLPSMSHFPCRSREEEREHHDYAVEVLSDFADILCTKPLFYIYTTNPRTYHLKVLYHESNKSDDSYLRCTFLSESDYLVMMQSVQGFCSVNIC